jgi:phosphoribosylaminoimidazole-succinocarboxamide synthase
MGIKTHFLEYVSPNGMIVKKVEIIQPEKISRESRRFLIPLEFICRWYAAGSLYDRIKSGEVSPKSLGFPQGHKVAFGGASSRLSRSLQSREDRSPGQR